MPKGIYIRTEKNRPNLGKHLSQEWKDKLSKSMMGRISPMKGKTQSEESRNKISDSNKGQIAWNKGLKTGYSDSISTGLKKAWKNPIKRKNMLDRCIWNNISCDKGQLELLNKWNKLGFDFIPNYQLKTDTFLAYLDGYDKNKNVILEYDSKYHNRPNQKKADLIRQQKIIDVLNPKVFWRYDSVNDEFTDVYRSD